MNLPNKITVFRMIMVPLFAVVALIDFPYHLLMAAIIFAVAAFSDAVDGHLARSMNIVSNFGKFMDPLADKMLVMTALICLIVLDDLPCWVVIIIVCRDFAVDGMRLMAAEKGIVIAASPMAKLKTSTQMIMVVLLLISDLLPYYWFTVICWVFIILAVLLTVVSGIQYLVKGKRFFTE